MGFAPESALTVVDLFSGCGGFSLGAQHAGFRVVAAFDNDPVLTSSYPYNFPQTKLFLTDVRSLTGNAIRAAASGPIDGIIGGPPCQGFSDIGRRDPSDPRRALLDEFFRIVMEVRPSFFVMENVRGLAYSDARFVLDAALRRVTNDYDILGPQIWNAADFGAATNRSRLFVVGVQRDRCEPMVEDDIGTLRCQPATVWDAVADLDGAIAVGDDNGFDVWRIASRRPVSAYARVLRCWNFLFTGHRATVHSEHVISRFMNVPEGGVDEVGRHPRLRWSGQCPVIRAGTGADRGSHQALRPIHPEQPRVITVREAARLQGFPDAHRFHSTIWHSFRMIGNSVSPIIAKAILAGVGRKLSLAMTAAGGGREA